MTRMIGAVLASWERTCPCCPVQHTRGGIRAGENAAWRREAQQDMADRDDEHAEEEAA